MISPAEFVPVAEEMGLIVPFGEWILRQACFEAARWPGGIRVAVNLSAVQFQRGKLLETVISALAASGLPAKRLELEITETALLKDDEGTLNTLRRLRELGTRISLDDFGTGYSSLSYLRSFPFDKIKIDQSFIRDLAVTKNSDAIVRAITSLATGLGMITTAEGVETEDQLKWLQEVGCTEVQGYLISRPIPPKAVELLLERTSDSARKSA